MTRPAIHLPMVDVVRHYKGGKSYAWLANKYGTSVGTIYNRLLEAGIGLRGYPHKRKLTSVAIDYDENVLDAEEKIDEADVLHELGVDT